MSPGTWHSVEELVSSTIVGLQEAAVHRPVQVRDEGRRPAALAHFFVALGDGVDVHQAVVGSNGEEGSVRRELQLVDHLLPVLNVDHLGHVPEKTNAH